MNARDDYATICRHGFGMVHRHKTFKNVLTMHLLRVAGLSYSLEVPFLVPNLTARPGDILD